MFIKNKKAQSLNNSKCSAQTVEMSFFKKPIMNKVPNATWTLDDEYKYIISDAAKVQVEELSNIADSEERRKYKARNFDYVTKNGVFSDRCEAGLVKQNNTVTIDIDHLGDKRKWLKDKLIGDNMFNTVFMCNSVGDGLHWTIRKTNQLSNSMWYQAIANYLEMVYGVKADMMCVNLSRAFFLGHDPECYINPEYSNF